MKYVVSYAGDGPEQAIMLATQNQKMLDKWVKEEGERPHKVVEADSLADLAKKLGHPIVDFEANVHLHYDPNTEEEKPKEVEISKDW